MNIISLNSISEGLFISFFSIMIVFSILGIIAFAIQSMQYLYKKPQIEIAKKVAYKKPFELSDIRDDEMMVAALVASIDYYEETQENVRILSIKEIEYQ